MPRARGLLRALVMPLALVTCSPSGPDQELVQLTLTSVHATPLPCRGNGPCPPNQPCPPDPPCNRQYDVDARLELRSLSGERFIVQSLVAELYDVHSIRVAAQTSSIPTVPFAVRDGQLDLHLSFLTGAGAEVLGGIVRVVVVADDGRGVRWELTANTPVVSV